MRISDWSSDVCSSDLRGVDLAGDERFLDLLGEEALAADLRQRALLDAVTGRLDDDDGNRLLGRPFGVRGGKAEAHLPGLGQRQRGAPRARAQTRFSSHGPNFSSWRAGGTPISEDRRVGQGVII